MWTKQLESSLHHCPNMISALVTAPVSWSTLSTGRSVPAANSFKGIPRRLASIAPATKTTTFAAISMRVTTGARSPSSDSRTASPRSYAVRPEGSSASTFFCDVGAGSRPWRSMQRPRTLQHLFTRGRQRIPLPVLRRPVGQPDQAAHAQSFEERLQSFARRASDLRIIARIPRVRRGLRTKP